MSMLLMGVGGVAGGGGEEFTLFDAFVNSGAMGSGTLGDPDDPFPTAVDAFQALCVQHGQGTPFESLGQATIHLQENVTTIDFNNDGDWCCLLSNVRFKSHGGERWTLTQLALTGFDEATNGELNLTIDDLDVTRIVALAPNTNDVLPVDGVTATQITAGTLSILGGSTVAEADFSGNAYAEGAAGGEAGPDSVTGANGGDGAGGDEISPDGGVGGDGDSIDVSGGEGEPGQDGADAHTGVAITGNGTISLLKINGGQGQEGGQGGTGGTSGTAGGGGRGGDAYASAENPAAGGNGGNGGDCVSDGGPGGPGGVGGNGGAWTYTGTGVSSSDFSGGLGGNGGAGGDGGSTCSAGTGGLGGNGAAGGAPGEDGFDGAAPSYDAGVGGDTGASGSAGSLTSV